MKKLIVFTMLTSLVFLNTLQGFAISSTKSESGDVSIIKSNRKKEIKVSPSKNKYEYINMEWWNGFNDEKLNGYITKSIDNNKDLKIATLTIDEYYQAVKAQRAAEIPSVYAGFSPVYSKFMGQTGGSFALPLIASYEVDIWGKNHNKTTAIKKMYEASILDEQAAYIMIASAVGATYINIIKLDAMIDLQTKIVDLRKNICEIMNISNKEGLVSTSDLVKAEKSYVAGISAMTELKKSRSKLLHQLAVLTGDSSNNIEDYVRTDYHDFTFSGNVPEYVSSEIIMNRPDYLKAEKLMEKAGIDVRIARKEMCPAINLGGLLLFNNQHIESLFTTSSMAWGFGGAILQPLFLGGRLKANLKAKKIAYERSLKNYEKVNLTSMQEVNDSLVSVNMDKLKLLKQKEIQTLEKEDFKLSNELYREGVISKLDLYQREENLLMIDKSVYDSEFECMVDYISYYKATAGAKNITVKS